MISKSALDGLNLSLEFEFGTTLRTCLAFNRQTYHYVITKFFEFESSYYSVFKDLLKAVKQN